MMFELGNMEKVGTTRRRNVVGIVTGCVALMGSHPAVWTQSPSWRAAQPDYEWSFPRDHWAHPQYKTEWWYFTGHLASRDEPDRRFGYQFTFFRVGITPERLGLESAWATSSLIMGHAAISDVTDGRHLFSELLYRTTPFLGGFAAPGDSLVAWSRAPAGTDGTWTLRWNGNGFDLAARDDATGISLELTTSAQKPLVFQGPNGYSRKGDGPTAASLYYSFTRLKTSGAIEINGTRYAVQGESWMDKEFGSNQLDDNQIGWDWFSLQLTDGRELMVYRLRNRGGTTDFGLGTIVDRDGKTRYLDTADWELTDVAAWRSPTTEARYPTRWKLSIPSDAIDLQIVPLFPGQENVSALLDNLFYWEGAVVVRDSTGASAGVGYVELTGYGTDSRPAI